MASSEGSAHSQWRRKFASCDATIFQIIHAAVAVAALDHPAEFEQKREGIVRRIYTGGILSCDGADDSSKDSIGTPVKGHRPVAESKKEDGPSASSTEKAPIKNELGRKNCSVRPHSTTPPAAAADRNKAPPQPSEQSMEAMLATAKRKLKESYDEHKEAKRQRKPPLVEAPEMARQRWKSQHHIIRQRDEVRCTATIAKRRAMMSTLRASWA
ncbi:unnamed protein product [Alopecurus aequalis]